MPDKEIPGLDPVTTPAATDEFGVRQSGDTEDKRETREQVHTLESGEHLILPRVNEPLTPTLAFGDGDSGIYEGPSEDTLRISTGGVDKVAINANGLTMVATSPVARLIHETATLTNPVILPTGITADGIGGTTTQLSFIMESLSYFTMDRIGNAEKIVFSPGANFGSSNEPFLAFGDADTGFYEGVDDTLSVTVGSQNLLNFVFGGAQASTQVIVAPGGQGTVATPGLAFGDGDTGWNEETDDVLTSIIAGTEQIVQGIDGKLFINTLTGVGADGGNISSVTPGLVSIYGAGFLGNGQAGNVEIWGGYADGTTSAAIGGDLVLWGGSGGGNDAQGGNAMVIGGFGDVDPGFALLRGGIATTGGNGGEARVIGGAGFVGNSIGGAAVITGGASLGGGGGAPVTVTGGIAGTTDTSIGGEVQLIGGTSGATNGVGGDILLTPGPGTGSGADGAINITQTTAPVSTTDKLYNLAGVLTWNGIDLTASGGVPESLVASNAAGPEVEDAAATSANPTFIPNRADNDTGIGWTSADRMTLIAGGFLVAEILSSGGLEQLILPLQNTAVVPSLAFGDGDSGFYESADDVIEVSLGTNRQFTFIVGAFESNNANGPQMLNLAATVTVPTLIPHRQDADTGIGGDGGDGLSLIAGGVEAVRYAEAGSNVLVAPNLENLVPTSSATSQGDNPLTSSLTVITAASSSAVTMPAVFAVDTILTIDASGAGENIPVFPALGDDIGAGVNVSIELLNGHVITYVATIANSTWEKLAPPTVTDLEAENASGPRIRDVTSSNTTPTVLPNKSNSTTGIGGSGTATLAMIAGSQEARIYTELSAFVIESVEPQTGLTAFAGGGAGSATPILASYSTVTTVATLADSVILPAVFKVGALFVIKNDGVADMDIFPASGDDLGAGVDTAVSCVAGTACWFLGTSANASLTQLA